MNMPPNYCKNLKCDIYLQFPLKENSLHTNGEQFVILGYYILWILLQSCSLEYIIK